MASQQIVFFDLPTKAPRQCWSPNPWKTRLVLNYKGLDYRTEWLEYPDVKPTLEKHFPADFKADQDPKFPKYTIPTIIDGSGTYTMDSAEIAALLEREYPEAAASRPLRLASPALARLQDELMPALFGALRPVYGPLVPERLLAEPSVEYWQRTRPALFGVDSLAQMLADQGPGCVFAFERAGPTLLDISALLRATDGQGPFFDGAEVGYADFVWGAFLICFRLLGAAEFESLLNATGDRAVHERLLAAVEPWAARNDH